MSDTTDKAKKPSDDGAAYRAVAITFLAVAVAMGVAQQNWAVALPFLVLGLTFFTLGSEKKKGKKEGQKKGEGNADEGTQATD